MSYGPRCCLLLLTAGLCGGLLAGSLYQLAKRRHVPALIMSCCLFYVLIFGNNCYGTYLLYHVRVIGWLGRARREACTRLSVEHALHATLPQRSA